MLWAAVPARAQSSRQAANSCTPFEGPSPALGLAVAACMPLGHTAGKGPGTAQPCHLPHCAPQDACAAAASNKLGWCSGPCCSCLQARSRLLPAAQGLWQVPAQSTGCLQQADRVQNLHPTCRSSSCTCTSGSRVGKGQGLAALPQGSSPSQLPCHPPLACQHLPSPGCRAFWHLAEKHCFFNLCFSRFGFVSPEKQPESF